MKKLARLKAIFILSMIVICSISNLFAATKFETSGQVKDKNNNEALEFCTVSIYNMNDSLITGGITNDKGFFNLPLEKGAYKIKFSYTGYKTNSTEIKISSEDLYIGTIKLEPNITQLGEVSVVSKTKEQHIDKDVQLVTKNLKVGAANTADVIGKMQGLTFDRYSKSIKVDGSEKVMLLVNGLEKDQEYIKNINPERVKEIEVIRNPSGRYAIEGYTAVINVILKSDYNGSELTINEDAYIDLDATKNSYKLPVNYFSASYNYNYNKFNFYAKYRNAYNGINLLNNTSTSYNDLLSTEYKAFDNKINSNSIFMRHQYTAGFDYYLNPQHTISFESKLQTMPSTFYNVKEKYNVLENNNDTITSYTTEKNNTSYSQNFTNTLFHIYKINKNNKINSDFSYNYYVDDYKNEYTYDSTNVENKGTNIKNATKFNVEFEHLFNEKSSLTIGYGNIWRKIENETLKNFSISEIRHKGYAYFSSKLNKIISFKIGGAAEFNTVKVKNNTKPFAIYQPHADLKFNLHKFLNVKFKYRAETEYPSIEQALPSINTIDKYTTEKGNPNLKTSLIHKVSANITAVQGLLTCEPYYNVSDNKIIKAIELNSNNKFEFNYFNAEKYTNKGIKGDITIPLFKQTLIIQSGMDYSNSSITHKNITNNVNDWIMNSQVVYIYEKLDLIGLLMYQKNLQKNITAQGYSSNGLDFWMLYVQKNFCNKKFTASLGYLIPTNAGLNFNQTQITQAGQYKETSISDISVLKNVVTVGLKYNLSTGTKVKKTGKEVKDEIERKTKSLF